MRVYDVLVIGMDLTKQPISVILAVHYSCGGVVATCAEIIIRVAIKHRKTRGLHYNSDYPTMSEQARNTIIKYN